MPRRAAGLPARGLRVLQESDSCRRRRGWPDRRRQSGPALRVGAQLEQPLMIPGSPSARDYGNSAPCSPELSLSSSSFPVSRTRSTNTEPAVREGALGGNPEIPEGAGGVLTAFMSGLAGVGPRGPACAAKRGRGRPGLEREDPRDPQSRRPDRLDSASLPRPGSDCRALQALRSTGPRGVPDIQLP